MILGVDVFSGYGRIDWRRVAADGVRFAIVKCTEGNEPRRDDSAFTRNVAEARAAGIIVGAYHFAYPLRSGDGKPAGRSPKEQAERFFAVSHGLGSNEGELPPALDLEWPARWDKKHVDEHGNLIDQWKRWDIDAQFIAEWGLECLEHIERIWGRVPILYEYPDFRRSLGIHGRSAAWTRYPLWIATYPKSAQNAVVPPDGAKPIMHGPWTDWAIWQFSADGSPMRIDGIPACPIDRNVIQDEETLRRLAGLDGRDGHDTEPEIRIVDQPIVHPPVPLGIPSLDGELPDTPDDAA